MAGRGRRRRSDLDFCIPIDKETAEAMFRDDVDVRPVRELTPLEVIRNNVEKDRPSFERFPQDIQDAFKTAPPDVLTKELPEIMKLWVEWNDLGHMEQYYILPFTKLALVCSERVPALKDVIGDYIIPTLVRYMGNSEHIRTAEIARQSLFALMKQELITKCQIEIQVCPSILALTRCEDGVDKFVAAKTITLMSRVAYLLGKDISERIFLKRFLELCNYDDFFIRGNTTQSFPAFCFGMSKETFENVLLPVFLKLCDDKNDLVRRSCVIILPYICGLASPEVRSKWLAPAFLKLLQDENVCVRRQAVNVLGVFIICFAEPPVVKFVLDENLNLTIVDENDAEYIQDAIEELAGPHEFVPNKFQNEDLMQLLLGYVVEKKVGGGVVVHKIHQQEEEHKHYEDDLLSYNEFNYWHISPDELDFDEAKPVSAVNDESANEGGDSLHNLINHIEELTISNVDCVVGTDISFHSLSGDISSTASPNTTNDLCLDQNSDLILPAQKIVPQELLDAYVSITLPKGEPTLNNSTMSYIAYFLPGVVKVLGKENYHLLKNVVHLLAGSMSYSTRKMVANSLHEIARILGPELASEELIPLFEGFLKDLDEVRICTLDHLSEFLNLILPEKRKMLLPKLGEFMRLDYACKWRFHETFAIKLTECLPLFDRLTVFDFITPHAQAFLLNRIVAIRQAGIVLVAEIVKHFSKSPKLVSLYLTKIAERFALAKNHKSRQAFVFLCVEILKRDAMDGDQFGEMLLPHVIDLSWDPVSNVRLAVADCINKHLLVKEHFTNPDNYYLEALHKTLRRLQSDKDRDVRMSSEFKT